MDTKTILKTQQLISLKSLSIQQQEVKLHALQGTEQ